MATLTETDVRMLLDAYEAADSDGARAEVRRFLAEQTQSDITDLYPRTVQHLDIDADKIVEEVGDDYAVPDIDEAREMLNDEAPYGGVIETTEAGHGELYVYGPSLSPDDFDMPNGWRAFKVYDDDGVGFTRADEPVDVTEARVILNEQCPTGFGAVIEAGSDVTGELYVASPNSGEEDVSHFDTPEGWAAIPDGNGSYSGVGFVRA